MVCVGFDLSYPKRSKPRHVVMQTMMCNGILYLTTPKEKKLDAKLLQKL